MFPIHSEPKLPRSDSHDPTSTMRPSKPLIRTAKWLIAILVAAGLVWATRSALVQWQTQTNAIEMAIAELNRSIESASDSDVVSALIQRRDALAASVPSLKNLRWGRIAMAAFFYAVGICVPGLVLHQALGSLGERPQRRTSIAAQLLGHAGKYVPGKAMVIVLRVGALSRDDVQPTRATISVFMETLLMMAVGATLACLVICFLEVPTWMIWASVGVAIVASIPTAPPILTRVAMRFAKADTDTQRAQSDGPQSDDPQSDDPQSDTEQSRNSQSAPDVSSTAFFLVGWTWSLVSWLLIGASFSLLVTAIPSSLSLDVADVTLVAPNDIERSETTPSATQLFAVSTAAIGLAMVVGFASLLPGGAGVRELVLTTILATAVGMSHALLAAVAARLMFIAVEAICAFAAWMWLRQSDAIDESSLQNDFAGS